MIVQYAAKPGLISMGTVQRISRPFDGVGSAPTAVELSPVWMEVALLQKTSFLDETSKRRNRWIGARAICDTAQSWGRIRVGSADGDQSPLS